MLAVVPDPATLLAYSLACFVLFMTPGPDMSLFLAKTMTGGRVAGIAAMAGTFSGLVVHSLLAAFGVSALIAASPAAFLALKVLGAGYLLWLAVDALRHGSTLDLRDQDRQETSLRRTYLLGLSVNLANPKIVLFFVTFLPQFVVAGDPAASGKLLFLGLYFIAFCVPLALALILVAERVVEGLKRNRTAMRAIDWLFAGVFGAFALKILATQAR